MKKNTRENAGQPGGCANIAVFEFRVVGDVVGVEWETGTPLGGYSLSATAPARGGTITHKHP